MLNIDDATKDWMIDRVGGVKMVLKAKTLDVPLPIASSILNLHGWSVSALTETKGSYVAEAVFETTPLCPQCGGSAYQKFGARDQEYHDLPVHMKRVTIMVHRQRYRCKSCGHVYVMPIPHMDDNHFMTERLVAYIRKESVRAPTFSALGRTMGLSADTIKNVFIEHLKELDKAHVIETPEWLGIDEKRLGGQWRCVFTDVKNRQPIEMLPYRDKPEITKFIMSLDRPKIVGVVIDMFAEYRSVVEELLPNAIIVVDKFHIVRMANECLDQVRRDSRDDMPHAQSKQLKRDRRLLMKKEKNLDEMQKFRLSTWLLNFDNLGKAYAAKEAYAAIWNSDSREIAEFLYNEWHDKLDDEIRPAFQKLTGATKRWWKYIFNYFDYPFTNAYTEAVNGIVKTIQQSGRGYSFEVIRAKMVYGLGVTDDEEVVPPDWW
jgi:transposase